MRRRCVLPDVGKYEFFSDHEADAHVHEHVVAVRAFAPPVLRHKLEDAKKAAELMEHVQSARFLIEDLQDMDQRERASDTEAADRFAHDMASKQHATTPSPLEIYRSRHFRDTTAPFLDSAAARRPNPVATVEAIQALYRRISVERLKNMKQLDDDNVSLHVAHNKMIGCLAVISATSKLMGVGDIDHAGTVLIAKYLEKNGAPFSWKSSQSFANCAAQPIYETCVPREHCILLAWRAGMLAMRYAVKIANPMDDFRALCEMGDEEYADARRDSTWLMMYALNIFCQVIPAQVDALHGSMHTLALSAAAAAMPEFRPPCINSMAKVAYAFIQSSMLRHMSRVSANKDADLKWIIASHERDRDAGDSGNTVAREKLICTKLVDHVLEGIAPKLSNGYRSFVFAQCRESLMALTENVWCGYLDDPMRSVYGEETNTMHASKVHEAVHMWIQMTGWESDEVETIANVYNAADAARSLRHVLSGMSIYMECLMSAKRIKDLDITSAAAVNMCSVLAQKIELLFSPVFGLRRCALELAAWLVSEILRRAEVPGNGVYEMLYEDAEAMERGKQLSSMWKFTRNMRQTFKQNLLMSAMARAGHSVYVDSARIQDPYDTNSMHAVSGSDMPMAKVLSTATSVVMNSFASRIRAAFGREAAAQNPQEEAPGEVDYDPSDPMGRRRHRAVREREQRALTAIGIGKAQRVVPLCEDEVDTWFVLVGAYDESSYAEQVRGGDAQSILEGSIHAFSVTPPSVYFTKEYTNMYNELNSAVVADVGTLSSIYFTKGAPRVKK